LRSPSGHWRQRPIAAHDIHVRPLGADYLGDHHAEILGKFSTCDSRQTRNSDDRFVFRPPTSLGGGAAANVGRAQTPAGRLNRVLLPMPRLIKIVLLAVIIVFVLLAVISRYLPPGASPHQHVGP
jgi:hypothetical protein